MYYCRAVCGTSYLLPMWANYGQIMVVITSPCFINSTKALHVYCDKIFILIPDVFFLLYQTAVKVPRDLGHHINHETSYHHPSSHQIYFPMPRLRSHSGFSKLSHPLHENTMGFMVNRQALLSLRE